MKKEIIEETLEMQEERKSKLIGRMAVNSNSNGIWCKLLHDRKRIKRRNG